MSVSSVSKTPAHAAPAAVHAAAKPHAEPSPAKTASPGKGSHGSAGLLNIKA
ncbi:MAG: hypothetical protein JWL84_4914 [Rhodospirillales bacterium]|nr:hypothetical protein [Rhodospirillales bacterium]